MELFGSYEAILHHKPQSPKTETPKPSNISKASNGKGFEVRITGVCLDSAIFGGLSRVDPRNFGGLFVGVGPPEVPKDPKH